MPIDLVQLRTFVVVAEEQHLTHAAERLHISPSAASAHVRALEERLGAQLFVRTNRSLELTRAGQLLAQKARTLLNEEALFAAFARELQGKIEGRLTIGTSSEPGTRIGEIVATLRTNHPLIHVDLMARASSGTHNGLMSGELDVGLLLGRPVDAAFTFYELTTVRYRIAGPVAWKDRILEADWAALASLPWLTPSTSSAHSAMLAQLFTDKGLALHNVVRFDNIVVGRAALQAGAGMMLLREEHATQGEQDGYLAISPIAHAETALSVGHQSGRKNDPLIEAFIEATRLNWPDMKLSESERKLRRAEG
jgi:DNA-binding transcriptional LysR family regulator